MKIAQGMLVMALDGNKMRLLRNAGDAIRPKLEVVKEEHATNPKSSDQGSDRPGRTFSSHDQRRSGYSDTDWHDEAESTFVAKAVEQLDQTCRETNARAVIFAAPKALGVFRKHIGAVGDERILAKIPKDMVNSSLNDIVEAVTEYQP